ncbi:MAG TPA: hypothetical protein PK675_02100 [Clostridia bacterium]|nr:hypothetical protein [Clostridia bacterium]
MEKKGLMIKSQVGLWPDWSTENIKNSKAREAAEWLISNGYENDEAVLRAFYDRQTSNMSDDPRAEQNDEIGIIYVADKIKEQQKMDYEKSKNFIEETVDVIKNRKLSEQTIAKKNDDNSKKYTAEQKREYALKKRIQDLENLDKLLPSEMKVLPNFCTYFTVKKDDGKLDKVIIDVNTGKRASPSDAASWTTYEQAVAYARKHGQGLSFALSKESKIIGIDIDKCIDESGNRSDLAWHFINSLKNSYAEKSTSGKGLHFFCKGNLPNNYANRNKELDLEMYDTERFISLTGRSARPMDKVVAGMDEIDKLQPLIEKYMPKRVQHVNNFTSATGGSLSDKEVLEKMFNSKNGNNIKQLFEGNIPNNEKNESDLKLCNHLAFFTDCNAQQMDRLFRSSSLYRPKWDERRGCETYGVRTVNLAINSLYNRMSQKNAKFNQSQPSASRSTNRAGRE